MSSYEDSTIGEVLDSAGADPDEEVVYATADEVVTIRQRRGAALGSLVGTSGRTFGSFFGEAVVRASTWATAIAVVAFINILYQLNELGKPDPRQLIPGLVFGVGIVVLEFSLWLWAYRHKDKGTALTTIMAYGLFGLSLAVLAAVWSYYPLHSIGVSADFIVMALIVELAAAKHGDRRYEQGRADERDNLVELAQGLVGALSVAHQHTATIERSATQTIQAAERVTESSKEVANASSKTDAALARAEHIRDNRQAEIMAEADKLVPDLVASKQGAAEAAHQQALVEARQAGYSQASGEKQELSNQLAAAVGLLQQHNIIDAQGRIIQQDQSVSQGAGG